MSEFIIQSRANQMERIVLRHNANKDVRFLHIANFLVSCQILSFGEAILLYKMFKLEEDVVFHIPDKMAAKFTEYLDSLNCKYE